MQPIWNEHSNETANDSRFANDLRFTGGLRLSLFDQREGFSHPASTFQNSFPAIKKAGATSRRPVSCQLLLLIEAQVKQKQLGISGIGNREDLKSVGYKNEICIQRSRTVGIHRVHSSSTRHDSYCPDCQRRTK